MEYSFLGKSGLEVSRLSFGAATFGFPTSADVAVGNIGVVETKEACRLIGLCRDAGVTYFDTADVYSTGDSEKILGEALKPYRKDIALGTKTTMPMGTGSFDRGASRRHIVQSCEDSLRRLGTDWIDLFQLHYPDYLVPAEETMRALDDLVRDGKVRYVGCSNYSGWHMMRSLAASDTLGIERFVSHQMCYSLIDRDAENELIPAALDQGVGLMAWGPLSGGFLSGKYRRGEPLPKGSRFEALPNYPPPANPELAYNVLDVLREIAEKRERTVGDVALNWVLRRPWIDTLILGARTEQQLVANLKAMEWSLGEDEFNSLEKASQTPLPYPNRIQRMINADRTPPIPAYRP
ncbi:aldo/keto reductase [Sphingobium sp.]|uniref:aldo/keto reductase n=1 Tax=Sphingobium sp. TaxID=1912891 RepID=UPI0028BD5C29|nr:aldo/keto reductase [Sphingobium sp.]